jgi:hypothetical protein
MLKIFLLGSLGLLLGLLVISSSGFGRRTLASKRPVTVACTNQASAKVAPNGDPGNRRFIATNGDPGIGKPIAPNGDPGLEKMPVDLETDYALSALPPHLRAGATVYLLDPAKGYYIARQGTNGFATFVCRTNWEWGEFRSDLGTAMSYDPEGVRTILPLYLDVAALRASGKYTASAIKDTMIARIKAGYYKAPARTGMSYMLAPLMRVYVGDPTDKTVMTVSMPHYMFYAPYLSKEDVGTDSIPFPQLINPETVVLGGKDKALEGYIIVPAIESEAAKYRKDGADLMKRLLAYKPYYKVEDM